MRDKLNVILFSTFFLFVSCVFIMPVSAENFKVMSEEYPPYNYTEDGKFTGLSTEVVREIMKRVGHPDNIDVMPWSRSYKMIQEKDGQVLFSTTRTEARENLFKWVGPLAANKWVFYARKGSNIKLSTLEEAKKFKKIGTYRDDACELFLKEKGFTNMRSVINDELNPQMLVAGRIDLWIVGEIQGIYKAKKKGVDTSQMEKVLDVKDTQLYIAFSKNTPDTVIAKWQDAMDKIRVDGTYDKILSKYMN